MTITIFLNGETRQVAAATSVAQLVDQLELTGKTIAIAINRQIVSKPQWMERVLEEHDKVEVVRAIGGG